MMTSRCALTLLVVCAGLVSACGSTSRAPGTGIGLDHRIGAVSFGERKDRVDAALGPGVSKNPTGLRGPFVFYPRAELYVGYLKHRGHAFALAIVTESPRYRTASGAGVGTTLEQLRKRVDAVCEGDGFMHGVLKSPSSNPGECSHDPANRNHPFTAFIMDSATERVTQIQIVPGGD
jgi:hypothetical protein